MSIPFIDLAAQNARLKDDINHRIQVVMDHGQFIMGPEVLELDSLKNLIKNCSQHKTKLICTQKGASLGNIELVGPILALIGPEGGFTKEEILAAETAGFQKVSLGPTILRVETACISVTSQIIGFTQ